MPVAYLDRIDTLSMIEHLGTVRSMVRKARVLFTTIERPMDFTVLKAALDVVPDSMSRLVELGYESLVLVERNPELAEKDPNVVDVTLKYEHILDGPNQILSLTYLGNPAGIIYGKGRCSIVEKKTNFYYPFGNKVVAGSKDNRQPIQVGYTYPPTDNVAAAQPMYDPIFHPMTLLQSGEINIPYPSGNFTMQGIMTTDNPWSVANQFIAKVNSATWLGKDPFTWICSEVQFDIIDVANVVYRFQFEFQYNDDTWDQLVWFVDKETGRAPAGADKQGPVIADSNGVLRLSINPLVPTLGLLVPNPQPAAYWNVPALKRADFVQLFGSYFEGVTQQQG